jgi:hypothetical protein
MAVLEGLSPTYPYIVSRFDAAWLADAMVECLLSTNKWITKSVLYGNLSLNRRQSSGLYKLLDDLALQANNQAGIYSYQLLSWLGRPPSIEF